MIRVAAGEQLPFRQDEIRRDGWAMECRINAEDPAAGFRPSPGTITRWQAPGGPGVRLDTHACHGYRVPPNYDSLVAKLLVYQPTRLQAIAANAVGDGALIVAAVIAQPGCGDLLTLQKTSCVPGWTTSGSLPRSLALMMSATATPKRSATRRTDSPSRSVYRTPSVGKIMRSR